jgi:hypothetical protein
MDSGRDMLTPDGIKDMSLSSEDLRRLSELDLGLQLWNKCE